MALINNPSVLPDNYVLTNDKGRTLAGGDIAQGLQFRAQGATIHGPATQVHAAQKVYDLLAQEDADARRREPMNGHRHTS